MNTDNDGNKSKKKIIALIATIVLILIAALLIVYFRSQIRATTMRILRIEGEVTLEDNGKEKTITDNMRLNSGNALSTAVKSLVSIGLDDTKIVTLDEISRAIFSQKGRKLDLELTDGSLFFEVSKKLDDEEEFAIRTTTMVVGIRGTSGWVSVAGDHESLIICDGHVHVIGTNPVTGETKEIEVYAGQRVSTYLYNDRAVDSIMFYVENITERDLPEFVLERLRENPELLEKVCRETGWDKPWILGIRVIEAALTPVPEVKNTTDTKKEDEPDDTEEEPEVPERSQANKQTSEQELEDLIEKMLALITPTPTPTPAPVAMEPYEDPYGDEEEEEEEKEEEPEEKEEEPENKVVAIGFSFSPSTGRYNPSNGHVDYDDQGSNGTFTYLGTPETNSMTIWDGTSINISIPYTISNPQDPTDPATNCVIGNIANVWFDAGSNGGTITQNIPASNPAGILKHTKDPVSLNETYTYTDTNSGTVYTGTALTYQTINNVTAYRLTIPNQTNELVIDPNTGTIIP